MDNLKFSEIHWDRGKNGVIKQKNRSYQCSDSVMNQMLANGKNLDIYNSILKNEYPPAKLHIANSLQIGMECQYFIDCENVVCQKSVIEHI